MKHPKPSLEVLEYVQELARLLGETETVPIKQIKRIVQICGMDFSREVYKETAEIEDKGGMMLPDNSRRRTRGGIFFYLVRSKVDEKVLVAVFPAYKFVSKRANQLPIGVPLLTWEERIAIIQSLQTEQGEIKSMKITINGRPGSVEKRTEVVVTTMSYVPSLPSLPRGIPLPPTTPTLYTIYMNPKQWERIEESLTDPADNMMVDGICVFDPDTQSIAILASSVRSEMLEAKTREEQKVTSEAQNKAAKANQQAKAVKVDVAAKAPAPAQPQAKLGPKKSRIADLQPEPVVVAVPLNPNLPPDVARKMSELQASANLFRQKVATIQGKPANQQFGLEMTQKLLKNVEDEIAALEKKYNN